VVLLVPTELSRSNALRWNATTSGRLSLNGSNETGYVVYEFPRRTMGTREKYSMIMKTFKLHPKGGK